MQDITQYIRNELNLLYTPSEIRTLTHMILEQVAGLSAADILAGKLNDLSNDNIAKIEEMTQRLKKSEPIQYVLGEAHFYNRTFKVTPDVLIPRPETEELIEWIVGDAHGTTPQLFDIGTGSGCIAITLAKELPGATVHACDISAKALTIAQYNAKHNDAPITIRQQDILTDKNSPIQYDIIVSNPPYITQSEQQAMSSNVLSYEPHLALFIPDDDPLLFYRHIAQYATEHLTNNGALYFEINAYNGAETVELLHKLGFRNVTLRNDISGNPRMIKANKPL